MTRVCRPLFFAAVAMLAASAFFPSAFAGEPLSRSAVEEIVHDYLSAHPEVVIEAISNYQANREDIERRTAIKVISTRADELFGPDQPSAGAPDGDVTIVEFFDYNCGYCKQAFQDLLKIMENDPKVRVVFRDIPILSESSHTAARYALAAEKQGRYFDYHKALMESHEPKTKASLEKIGEDIGLDVKQLRADAESETVNNRIKDNLALSRDLSIRGTPAFIIGDMLAPGYMTWTEMEKTIKTVRDAKK